MNATFSFVLPAYKAKFLEEAIKSILCQTYPNFELIIVNDCSPEDIDSIVARFKDNRVRYYKNAENIGGKDLVKQWNHCITYAKNEYLILASDDDYYDKDFLKEVNALAGKYPQVDLIRSRVVRVNCFGEVTDIDSIWEENLSCDMFVYRWSHDHLRSIANYVFKRKELLANGGFVDFPSAWFSDDATILLNSYHGIANTYSCLFYSRLSNINISSDIYKKSTLQNKLVAVEKFYLWFRKFIKKYVKDTPLTRAAYNLTVKRCTEMFNNYVSPYRNLGLINGFNAIRESQLLNKNQKIHTCFSYLRALPKALYYKAKR